MLLFPVDIPFMFMPIVGWVLLLMIASADVPEGAPEGLQFPAVSQAPLEAPVQVCPDATLPHITIPTHNTNARVPATWATAAKKLEKTVKRTCFVIIKVTLSNFKKEFRSRNSKSPKQGHQSIKAANYKRIRQRKDPKDGIPRHGFAPSNSGTFLG